MLLTPTPRRASSAAESEPPASRDGWRGRAAGMGMPAMMASTRAEALPLFGVRWLRALVGVAMRLLYRLLSLKSIRLSPLRELALQWRRPAAEPGPRLAEREPGVPPGAREWRLAECMP